MQIVLGVTGGIAAYKAVLLARMLVEAGHELHVVPTENALRFVGTPTWEAISRHPVTHSVHDDVAQVRHVALGQQADLVIVAPATANIMARMAAGIADDLLGTTLLATRAPVLIAPAMHTEMWQHPATQANLRTLTERGVRVVGPDAGRLTGTDTGVGRMSEPEEICAVALGMMSESSARSASASDHTGEPDGDYRGLRVLISTGGTREPIDPVRYLGNRSSGKQGVALAAAARDRGATVTLLSAHVSDSVLAELNGASAGGGSVEVVPVTTAAELQREAERRADAADVVIMAAAVADYRVDAVANEKLRKEAQSGGGLTLHLVENPDILLGLVRASRPEQTVVGFAAETAEDDAELLERGRHKLARKGADLLVVNKVGWSEGFETSVNTVHVLDASGRRVLRSEGQKRDIADDVLDAVLASHLSRASLENPDSFGV